MLLALAALSLEAGAWAAPASPGRGWEPLDLSWHPSGDAVSWLEADEAEPGRFTLVTVDLRGIKRWLVSFGGAPPPQAKPPGGDAHPSPAPVAPAPTPAPTPLPALSAPVAPVVPTAPSSLYDLPTEPADLSRGLVELESAAEAPAELPAPPPPVYVPASGPPWSPVPLFGYRWLPRGDGVLVSWEDDLYAVSIPGGEARRLTSTPGIPEVHLTFSPDGERLAFGAADHVWVVELSGASPPRRISPDAAPRVHQGQLDWMYEEELGEPELAPIAFSPDGQRVAYLALDDTGVPHHPLVHHTERPARLEEQPYPLPGDPLPRPSVQVVDLVGNPLGGWALEEEGYILPALTFTPDSDGVALMTLDRPQETFRLLVLDVDRGRVTVHHELTMPHWHNAVPAPRFLPDGRHYVLMSPWYGFVQPYVGNLSFPRRKLKRLMNVPWNLSLAGIDPSGDSLYFTGSGDVSTEQHLFKVRRGGGGMTRMTLRWGWHEVEVSPRGGAFVDTFSSADALPQTTLWKDRTKIADLHRADATVDQAELGTREILSLRTEGDVKLYAELRKPPGFDPAQRYPAVVLVYGGPWIQTVTERYKPSALVEGLLARGYVVFGIDNRGSGGRMHRFEAAVDQELGRVELEDQLLGLAELRRRKYIDADRIGIVGASYGGYMVLYAMTRSDAFPVGVAIAPVTDWRRYDAAYVERYMGLPAENPEGYERSSVVGSAASLKGDLLLIHSLGDENVHFDHTAAFLSAAMEAGLDPEVMILPTSGHRLRAMSATERALSGQRLLDFLDAHLQPE